MKIFWILTKKLLKNRNETFPVVHFFTWKLELVSIILWMILAMSQEWAEVTKLIWRMKLRKKLAYVCELTFQKHFMSQLCAKLKSIIFMGYIAIFQESNFLCKSHERRFLVMRLSVNVIIIMNLIYKSFHHLYILL